jgi:hypothetical protein
MSALLYTWTKWPVVGVDAEAPEGEEPMDQRMGDRRARRRGRGSGSANGRRGRERQRRSRSAQEKAAAERKSAKRERGRTAWDGERK